MPAVTEETGGGWRGAGYKTSWNFSKFVDIYNIIIDLDTRDGILIVMNSERFYHF